MSRPKLTGPRCQCPTCGELFASPRAFDRHRIGPYGLGLRRCLDPAELRAHGWAQTDAGFWLTPDRRRAGEGHKAARKPLPATWVARHARRPRKPRTGT
jgi:hypothetical protein